MAELLRIGQLASHCGVTVRAVRHYHRVGLLPEPGSAASSMLTRMSSALRLPGSMRRFSSKSASLSIGASSSSASSLVTSSYCHLRSQRCSVPCGRWA
jgi:hypothetical protein